MELTQQTLSVIIAIVVTVPFIAIFTYVIYHFGHFIYHWHKIVTNVTNRYAMFMGPLILFRNSNFNEVGSESLSKAKYHFRRFVYPILITIVLFLAFTIYKNNAG